MKSFLKKLPTYLFELLVVFVGVYAAFALNNYRESQKAIASQIKFAESFRAEIEYNGKYAQLLKHELDSIADQLEKDIEAGLRPPLDPIPQLRLSVGTFITRAAFNENHFEAIDQQFLFNISQGVVLFDDIQNQIELFHQKAREQLYVSEPDFYLPSGQLKPEYRWYLDDLKNLRFLFKRLEYAIEKGAIPGTDSLIQKLKDNQHK